VIEQRLRPVKEKEIAMSTRTTRNSRKENESASANVQAAPIVVPQKGRAAPVTAPASTTPSEAARLRELEELVANLQSVNLQKETQLQQLSEELKKKEEKISHLEKSVKSLPTKSEEKNGDQETEKRSKKQEKEKEKDTSGIRKPATSYVYFSADYRQIIKDANPDKSSAEISALLNRKWRELPQQQKEPYILEAEKDLERYRREKAEYDELHGSSSFSRGSSPEIDIESCPKGKKEKDLNAPKRPQSAFFLFCLENRGKIHEKCPDLKPYEISAALGQIWKTLSDSKKKVYLDMAEIDTERYHKEKEAYYNANRPSSN
jgi:septal ring factor EnvC (AmiA/AmiB activator)